MFCHLKIRGKGNLKGVPKAIFALNHSSELDVIILTASLSPFGRFAPMFYLSAPDTFFDHEGFGWRRYIYGGLFFKAWGAYPAKKGLKDYGKALDTHVALLNDGATLCVFPEGNITKDGSLREGHGGVVYLCRATGIPIIPVAISGSFQLSVKQFLSGYRRLRITFGAPLYPQDLLSNPTTPEIDDYKKAAQAVMRRIHKIFQNI